MHHFVRIKYTSKFVKLKGITLSNHEISFYDLQHSKANCFLFGRRRCGTDSTAGSAADPNSTGISSVCAESDGCWRTAIAEPAHQWLSNVLASYRETHNGSVRIRLQAWHSALERGTPFKAIKRSLTNGEKKIKVKYLRMNKISIFKFRSRSSPIDSARAFQIRCSRQHSNAGQCQAHWASY